jgi:hypothetical protein
MVAQVEPKTPTSKPNSEKSKPTPEQQETYKVLFSLYYFRFANFKQKPLIMTQK